MAHKIEEVLEFLDECRLNGDNDYTKREKLMTRFHMPQNEADICVEAYRTLTPTRKQFLQESK